MEPELQHLRGVMLDDIRDMLPGQHFDRNDIEALFRGYVDYEIGRDLDAWLELGYGAHAVLCPMLADVQVRRIAGRANEAWEDMLDDFERMMHGDYPDEPWATMSSSEYGYR